MNIKDFNTVSACELFDSVEDARPEAVYLIESLDFETGNWSNQADAKIIFLGEETALYFDDIQGYKILTDLDFLDGNGNVRFVPLIESTNQDYILNLIEWESVNGYSTAELIKECFNCREVTIDEDGDVAIADPQASHILSNDELTSFVEWHKAR